MDYCSLLKPLDIRGLKLKNRVIFPAIATKMVDEDACPTENLINYHLKRVEGGSGLNILESSSVHGPSGPKDFLSISKDESIEKYKNLVDKVHEAGGKIGIQLWQSGIYNSNDLEREIIVPSEYITDQGRKIRAASLDKIKELVESFSMAAARAKKAGFDAVELNIGHNDSMHLFLSPNFNKRKDSYGGSLENRLRYSMDIIKSIRRVLGENIPIFIKMISRDDGFKVGLEEDETMEIIKNFENAGVDLVSIYRGNPLNDSKKYELPTIGMKKDYNLDYIKKLRRASNLLLAAGTGITEPKIAEDILSSGACDMVYIGRAFLADPFFMKKVIENRSENIVKCIGCNQGCYDTFNDILYPTITCLRNPAIGKEKDYSLKATNEAKKIAIIGGGIGGIISAKILKRRGHKPEIYEKNDRLGGNYILASKGQGKKDFKELLNDNIAILDKLEIPLQLGREFRKEDIIEAGYDKVIIATGSEPRKPDFIGLEQDFVHYGIDYLKYDLELEGETVIIGSDRVGLELAELISQKNPTTLVEETDIIGKDVGEIRRIGLLENLEKNKVKIHSDLKIDKIGKRGIYFKKDGKKHFVNADNVLISKGFISNKCNDIKQFCQDREIPFYVLGDALIPRTALEAVLEAVNIGLFEIE